MRKILPRCFALVLCLSITVSTALAAGLTPIRDYAGSGFTDVPNDWSYPYISACYELGLMSGHGNGRFAPNGSVSVAEGITVAARVHHLWRGGDGVLPGGSPWYAGAVDYALKNGLITQGQFSNYNAAATRGQLADLLAKALPEEDYVATGVNAAGYTLVPEEDMAGEAVTPLLRSTYWDTVTAIHDYVVNTLTYDPFTAAPAGATQAIYDEAEAARETASQEYSLRNNITLAAKYGICQDYAELFRTMCIRAGIPCLLVRGTAGGPHVWNMVYVDGEWRYVDCTWDDPVVLPPMLLHDYFLIGPDQLAQDHSWEGSDYPMPTQAED